MSAINDLARRGQPVPMECGNRNRSPIRCPECLHSTAGHVLRLGCLDTCTVQGEKRCCQPHELVIIDQEEEVLL